jgi:altronate dehydratase
VRDTAVIGLGCEGIPASTIYRGIVERGRAATVVTIQSAGGTAEAAQEAASYLLRSAASDARTPVPLAQLVLGVGLVDALKEAGQAIVAAFLARGGTVLQATTLEPSDALDYGEPVGERRGHLWMRVRGDDSETLTGLAAAGAQVLLAQADAGHLGGHPIVPTIRIGYDERWRTALVDEMDGMIQDIGPEQWVDRIVEVASGALTASERLGSGVFAIERIGPTL